MRQKHTFPVVVQGADCPVCHFYMPKGNPTKEDADVALMAYYSEEVETEYPVNKYWKDTYY